MPAPLDLPSIPPRQGIVIDRVSVDLAATENGPRCKRPNHLISELLLDDGQFGSNPGRRDRATCRQSRNYLVEARIEMPKIEQERLAVIRYNYVSVEYVRGLGECQIMGYLEPPTLFNLLHSDALEQESLSCHLQTHGSHIPVAWDFLLLCQEPRCHCATHGGPFAASCKRLSR